MVLYMQMRDKDSKLKVGENQNIKKITKGYPPDWSEKIFQIQKVKRAVPWAYVISNLNREEIVGTFKKNSGSK